HDFRVLQEFPQPELLALPVHHEQPIFHTILRCFGSMIPRVVSAALGLFTLPQAVPPYPETRPLTVCQFALSLPVSYGGYGSAIVPPRLDFHLVLPHTHPYSHREEGRSLHVANDGRLYDDTRPRHRSTRHFRGRTLADLCRPAGRP